MQINREDYYSPNFWTPADVMRLFDYPREVRAVTIHDTEGTYPDDVQYLCARRADNPVSAHYYVLESYVYELVDPDNAAWHAATTPETALPAPGIRGVIGRGNENVYTVGIEISGLKNGAKSDAAYASVAALIQYLMKRYPAIKLDRNHIFGHYEINSIKVDPAPWDWDKLFRLIRPVPVEPFPPLSFQGSPFTVQGGFREFYEAHGGEAVFGLPLSAPIEPPAGTIIGIATVQYFDTVRFDYYPNNPPGRRVALAPLGRQALHDTGTH